MPVDDDPFALSERDEGRARPAPSAANEPSANSSDGLSVEFDAYGIAPRKDGGGADLSSVRPTPESEEMDFDPYGLVDRGAAPTAKPAAKPKKRRKPARLRISYKNARTFVKEYSRNVSRGGTFIKTKKPLAVGRDCVLFLTVPGVDEPIELKGAVVWSSRDKAPEPGKDEGMGIKFDTGAGSGLQRVTQTLFQLQA
jgi:uncharacterized protein (TIGR02266 family)